MNGSGADQNDFFLASNSPMCKKSGTDTCQCPS